MQGMRHAIMGMSKAATLPDKLAERETMLLVRLEAVRKTESGGRSSLRAGRCMH